MTQASWLMVATSDIVHLNNELRLLTNWLKANKLSLNVQKTFHIVFHRARMKNKDFDTSIVCMNGMELEETDCLKHLWVILDSNIIILHGLILFHTLKINFPRV